MGLEALDQIDILEDVVLHRARNLLDRTIEHEERITAHPIRHTVHVCRCMRPDTAAVGPQLLEAKSVRRSQVLLTMERRVGEDQNLTARTDRGNNGVAVREPLSTGRVDSSRHKVSDVLLIGEPHKHRILRSRSAKHCLRSKAHQMPVRGGHQRVLAFGRCSGNDRGTGGQSPCRGPLVDTPIHYLGNQVLTVIVKLPYTRIQLHSGRRRTRRAPGEETPRSYAPAEIKVPLVGAYVDLIVGVGRPCPGCRAGG